MKRVLPIQKRVFVLLLALGLGMGTTYAYNFSAVCSTGQTLYYNITDANHHYVEVTAPDPYYWSNPYAGYTQPSGALTVPRDVYYNGQDYTVKSIGYDAFCNCTNLTSVTISSGITAIDREAFSLCAGLNQVNIPGTVTSIGSDAFSGCTRMTRVDINNFNAWSEIDFANANANPLSYAHHLYINGNEITELLINVDEVKDYALYGCTGLTKLIFTNTVNTIGRAAFSGCSNLQNVTFDVFTLTSSFSLTSIGADAFEGCNGLQWVDIRDLAGWCGVSFGNASANPIGHAMILKINGESISNLTIPSGVTTIKSYAFYGATWPTSVTIPPSVTTIGEDAFYGCNNLTKVDISSLAAWCKINFADADANPIAWAHHIYLNGAEITNLEVNITGFSIKPYAFYGASHLTSLNCTCNWIGNYAFYGCSGLTTVNCGALYILDHVFSHCSNLSVLKFFGLMEDIGRQSFEGCTNLSHVEISSLSAWCTIDFAAASDNPLSIAKHLYRLGSEVTELVIPNDVTTIKKYAFYGLSSLTSVSIPSSVTTIGEDAFGQCSGLTRVNITDVNAWCGIDFANSKANPLYYANHLYSSSGNEITSLIISNDVTTIKSFAFCGATGLITVRFPWFVTNIEDNAFTNCTGLKALVFTGIAPPTASQNAFLNIPTTIPVYIPNDLTHAQSNQYYIAIYSWGFNNIYSDYCIYFSDHLVKQLCLDHWNTDNDDYLSVCEAAVVSDLGDVFRNNTAITKFEELQYFIGLTSIDNNAFDGCSSMTSIKLPPNVHSIGTNAFRNCQSLQSINIPSKVTSISNNSFLGCSALGKLTVSAGNAVYDSRNSCNAIIRTNTNALVLGCKNTVVPNDIISIEGYAFSGCSGLTSITLPSSLTQIGPNAFDGCTGLASITVWATTPPSVGENAFLNVSSNIPLYVPCESIAAYQNAEGWNHFNNIFGADCNIVFADPNVKAICVDNWDTNNDGELSHAEAAVVTTLNPSGVTNNSAFRGNTTITSFDELQYFTGLTNIDYNAFSGCVNLASVTLPSTITQIINRSFEGCTSLASIIIPSMVTNIGPFAFDGCTDLNSIIIQGELEYIRNSVFRNCTSLTFIIVNATTPPSFGSQPPFLNVPTGIPVYVPCGKKTAYQNASGWSSFTNYHELCEAITFADANVKAICVANWDTNGDGELSYGEAAAVTTLNPSGSPNNSVFKNNTTITSFDELQHFTALSSIGSYAFNGCSNLQSVTLPGSVITIGYSAFYDCQNLTSAVLSGSLTSISDYAFAHTGLTSIQIPRKVISIGSNPFLACHALASITVETGNTVYDSRDNCNAIIETSNNNLITGCKNTVIPDGPNGVVSIEASAFNLCIDLNSIILPSTLSTIGSNAFYGCARLKSITVNAATPPLLETASVFGNVPADIPVYVPCESVADYQSSDWTCFNNIVGGDCPIVFADANVKSVCVSNWDTNGDGELSYAEAAAVTTLISSGNSVFRNNTTITSFNELQYFIGLSAIEANAFFGCSSLASVSLPSGLTSISNNAFLNCRSLVSIIIPSSVYFIGENPFKGCSALGSIFVMPGNTYYDSRDNCNAIIQTATNTLITGCKNTVIPDGLSAIGTSAFSDCPGLSSIILPGSVTIIGDNAFFFCTGLHSITVESTTPPTVGANAFLSVITNIPVYVPCGHYETYNNVSWGGFTNFVENCIDFADANVKAICVANWDTDGDGELSYTEAAAVTSLKSSGTSVFENTAITSFNELQYFTGLTSIETFAFSGCTSLASVTLPSWLPTINDYAFNQCQSLTSIDLRTVATIGDFAFNGCTALASVSITSYVTSIGDNPFSNCAALESINVWAGNTIYGSPNGCNAIIETATNKLVSGCKNTVIPSTVTSIGSCAFYGCTDLTSFTIPGGVTTIGASAFYGCTGMTALTVEASIPPTLGNIFVFYNVPTDIPVNVFCGTKAAYQAAMGWSDFTNFVDPCEAIVFADENVKAICVANWDTNGDNELSYDEAAAVTSLGSVFYEESITTFDELQYFTGLEYIDDEAFANCTQLTSVIIPSSVTFIAYESFWNCSSLTSVTIPGSVTTIGDEAFYDCSSLTSVTIPGSVTTIGYEAFSDCSSLTSIIISNGVTTIGYDAFYGCSSLTSVTIPSTVTTMIGNLFPNCPALASITVEAGNTVYDSRDNCNAIIETATNTLIAGCKNTVVPNTVTTIGSYAFNGCTSLTSITIPSTVTSIGSSAFSGCSGLTEMTVLATTPPTLDPYVFQNVPTDIPVTVPCEALAAYQNYNNTNQPWGGFTNIVGDGCDPVIVFEDPAVKAICVANWNTNGDGELSYPEAAAVTSLGGVFQGNAEITSFDELQYFTNVTVIQVSAFSGCSGLESVTLPDALTTIGSNAFRGCSSLESITLPNSLTTILDYAFYGCSSLTTIEIPNTVNSLGRYVFSQCTGLTSVTLPNSLTTIKTSLLEGCSSLTSIIIPDAVTSIENAAFRYCSSLTSIEIPNAVTSIGSQAFNSCTNLQSITCLPTTPPTLVTHAFSSATYNSATLTVPCGSISAYQSASYWSNFTHIVGDCEQATALEAGWNWWAPTVEMSLEDFEAALVGISGDILINSQDEGFARRTGGTWDGTLTSIELGKMYKIKTTAGATLTMAGDRPATVSVSILPGYTWFGYTGAQATDIAMALGNLGITPASGDTITDKNGNTATYNGSSWSGDLITLQPGHGYIYLRQQ